MIDYEAFCESYKMAYCLDPPILAMAFYVELYREAEKRGFSALAGRWAGRLARLRESGAKGDVMRELAVEDKNEELDCSVCGSPMVLTGYDRDPNNHDKILAEHWLCEDCGCEKIRRRYRDPM